MADKEAEGQRVILEDGSEAIYLVVQEGDQTGEGVEYINLGGDGQETIVLTEEQLRNYTSEGGSVEVLESGGVGQAEDGGYEVVQIMEQGDEQQQPPAQLAEEEVSMVEPIPQGMKMRRNRVFGHCRCPECGQTFINSARLERHLAVHQVFGSYLCPLCGKTFKYEYNLFYHWRRSCRDLNELMGVEDRKTMDINSLRTLVDEVAAKKAELGTLEPGLRRLGGKSPENKEPPPPRTELPQARRGEPCPECGVVVLASHLERHMAIHRGETEVDSRGVGGGFYCDLCGLMFRQHFNLIKHWRSSCPEIQIHINPREDTVMDDEELKKLVSNLLKKKREEAEGQGQEMLSERKERKQAEVEAIRDSNRGESDVGEEAPALTEEADKDEEAAPPPLSPRNKANVREGGEEPKDIDVTTVNAETAAGGSGGSEEAGWPQLAPSELVEREEEMYGFEERMYDMGEEGDEEYEDVGPLGFKTSTSRAKWSMVRYPPFPFTAQNVTH